MNWQSFPRLLLLQHFSVQSASVQIKNKICLHSSFGTDRLEEVVGWCTTWYNEYYFVGWPRATDYYSPSSRKEVEEHKAINQKLN